MIFDGGTWWGMANRHWLIGSVCLGPPLGAVGALIQRSGPIGTLAVLLVPAGSAPHDAAAPAAGQHDGLAGAVERPGDGRSRRRADCPAVPTLGSSAVRRSTLSIVLVVIFAQQRQDYFDALGWVSELITATGIQQLGARTPCEDFDVRSLLGHTGVTGAADSHRLHGQLRSTRQALVAIGTAP